MRHYSSLRRKMTGLIAGGGIASAVIATAGFSWLDLNRFWENTNARIVSIASIVADQVEPAITLGDRKAAAGESAAAAGSGDQPLEEDEFPF